MSLKLNELTVTNPINGSVTGSAATATDSTKLPLTGGTLSGQLSINHSTPTSVLRLYSGGSTVWSLGVGDNSGSYFNLSADFGSFTINKTNGFIGVGTTSQVTRLQLGSGTPTGVTEGIQFGGDTSARLYRTDAGVITCPGTIAATFSGNLTGNVTGTASTATNATQLGGIAAANYSNRYTAAITGVNSSTWTTVCNVDGDNLSTAIRATFNGTSNSVVVNVVADILVNHSQDILVWAYSGFYSKLSIRIISNNNEDYTLQIKHDGASTTTIAVEIFTLNSETITFNPASLYSTLTFDHVCEYGVSTSATGGNSSDIRTAGVFYGAGTGLTGTAANLTVGTANAVSTGAVKSGGLDSDSVITVKIANSNVTYAKIQNVTNSTVLGRITAGAGVVEELTGANLATIIGANAVANATTAASCSGNAANVTGTVAVANGGTGATTAANARTNLGATTVGGNFFTLANPSAITFPRINADNTVSALDAATFKTALGITTSSGTVTSVSGTGTVSGITLSGTVTTSGNLTLGGSLSGTASSLTAGAVTDGVYLSTTQTITGVKTFSSAPIAVNIAKAWVHFNGTSAVGVNCTINASYNVSSVAHNATGDYTVSFTNAMVDANYAVAGTATYDYTLASSLYGACLTIPRQTNAQVAASCRLAAEYLHGANLYDAVAVRAVFYR